MIINVSQEIYVSFCMVELWRALLLNVEVAGSFEISVHGFTLRKALPHTVCRGIKKFTC